MDGGWQASKGVFNELSCQAAVGDAAADGAVTSLHRGQFDALIHKHVGLHRDQPLSQEDLEIACRCGGCRQRQWQYHPYEPSSLTCTLQQLARSAVLC